MSSATILRAVASGSIGEDRKMVIQFERPGERLEHELPSRPPKLKRSASRKSQGESCSGFSETTATVMAQAG